MLGCSYNSPGWVFISPLWDAHSSFPLKAVAVPSAPELSRRFKGRCEVCGTIAQNNLVSLQTLSAGSTGVAVRGSFWLQCSSHSAAAVKAPRVTPRAPQSSGQLGPLISSSSTAPLPPTAWAGGRGSCGHKWDNGRMMLSRLTLKMQKPAQGLRNDNEIPSFLLLKFLSNYHVNSISSLIKKLFMSNFYLIGRDSSLVLSQWVLVLADGRNAPRAVCQQWQTQEFVFTYICASTSSLLLS